MAREREIMTVETKTKHTPGPWKAASVEDNRMTCVYTEETNVALLVHHNDARLIASASELLEALKNLCIEMSFMLHKHPSRKGGLYERRLKEGKQAISKAEGKSC